MYVLKIELTERLWYEKLTANKGREAGLFQGEQDYIKGSRTISIQRNQDYFKRRTRGPISRKET